MIKAARQQILRKGLFLILFASTAFMLLGSRLHALNLKKIKTEKLYDGLTIIYYEDHSYPVLHIKLFARGGVINDSIPGLSNLVMNMLAKGSENFSEQEYYERLDRLGAVAGFTAADDYNLISIKQRSAMGLAPVQFVLNQLMKPNFSAENFSAARKRVLSQILNRKNYPMKVMFDEARKQVYYGEKYELPIPGTVNSVEKISLSDVKQRYNYMLQKEKWIVVVVGDFDMDYISGLKELLKSLKLGTAAQEVKYISNQGNKYSDTVTLQLAGAQSYIMLATKIDDKDMCTYATLKLLANYLGGESMNSALFYILRERLGSAYTVFSFYNTRIGPSIFAIYFDAIKGREYEALQAVENELSQIRAGRLDKRLFSESALNLKNSLYVTLADNSNLAWYLGFFACETGDVNNLNQFLNAIDDVSVEDVVDCVVRKIKYFKTIIAK